MIIIKFAALTQSLRLIGFVTRLCVSACKSTIFDIFYLLWLSPTMFNFSFQISITNRLCLHSHTSKMVKYQVGKKERKILWWRYTIRCADDFIDRKLLVALAEQTKNFYSRVFPFLIVRFMHDRFLLTLRRPFFYH